MSEPVTSSRPTYASLLKPSPFRPEAHPYSVIRQESALFPMARDCGNRHGRSTVLIADRIVQELLKAQSQGALHPMQNPNGSLKKEAVDDLTACLISEGKLTIPPVVNITEIAKGTASRALDEEGFIKLSDIHFVDYFDLDSSGKEANLDKSPITSFSLDHLSSLITCPICRSTRGDRRLASTAFRAFFPLQPGITTREEAARRFEQDSASDKGFLWGLRPRSSGLQGSLLASLRESQPPPPPTRQRTLKTIALLAFATTLLIFLYFYKKRTRPAQPLPYAKVLPFYKPRAL